MKLVLLPGWHESGDHMRTFVEGRGGLPAFAQLSYDCAIFPQGTDPLRERIDRFAAFIADIRLRQPHVPIVTFGYSAGGLINRGYLRAYPDRANDIFATIQVGAPNGGLIANYVANTLRLLRVPDHVVADVDVASPFMTWLNGTSGHWVERGRKDGKKKWVLDTPAIVGPAGARLLHVVGRVPKYRFESDGVVMVESATLEDRVPCTFIDHPDANHLNLGAVSNPIILLARGFWANDKMWPRSIEITSRYLTEEFGYELDRNRSA